MANPQDGDLYGGLAGLKLDGPRFEIGQGAYIQGTFAHLMAPFILAFAKGEHGKAHPGPWRSASGGLAVDIVAEIVIPASFSVPKWFDRLNAIWWLLALLRVRVSQLARIPVIASIPFALARALMSAGQDRARAIALAKAAHDGYRSIPGHEKELTAVDDWLAAE
jgi:hypothetical protein